MCPGVSLDFGVTSVPYLVGGNFFLFVKKNKQDLFRKRSGTSVNIIHAGNGQTVSWRGRGRQRGGRIGNLGVPPSLDKQNTRGVSLCSPSSGSEKGPPCPPAALPAAAENSGLGLGEEMSLTCAGSGLQPGCRGTLRAGRRRLQWVSAGVQGAGRAHLGRRLQQRPRPVPTPPCPMPICPPHPPLSAESTCGQGATPEHPDKTWAPKRSRPYRYVAVG